MSELNLILFEYYVIVFFLSLGGKRIYFIFYFEGGILGI